MWSDHLRSFVYAGFNAFCFFAGVSLIATLLGFMFGFGWDLSHSLFH